MKKSIILILAVCVLSAALSGCIRFISDTGGYYIPSDLANFTSITCVNGDNKIKVQKKDNYFILLSQGKTFILTEKGGAEFAGETMAELDAQTAKAALYNVFTETGLVYSSLQKQAYLMTDTSGKYRADAEKFFYSAEYMRKVLKGESTENFSNYFESNISELAGDIDDYEVTLDCSKQNTVKLKIENKRTYTSTEYTFTDIDDTQIPLTQKAREYLAAHTLSA